MDETAPAPATGTSADDARAARLPVLHAVTDDLIVTRPEFLGLAAAVMQATGPRGAVHLRTNLVPARRLFALAQALVEAQRETGAWLIVTDRVDIAAAADARAVQLTSRSMRVADARRAAPMLEVGASVHAVDSAEIAEREGAAWVVAGHVFATATHPGAPGRGVEFVRAVRRATTLPVLAIGGVTPARVAALLDAGAHGVAVIRGVWAARDAERAATQYLEAYDAHGGHRD